MFQAHTVCQQRSQVTAPKSVHLAIIHPLFLQVPESYWPFLPG